MRHLRLLALAVMFAALAAPAAAHAFRLPERLAPVKGNPADALADLPADAQAYDRARRCDRRAKPGVVRFVRWLERNARGESWGTYRCERWGKGEASLHAEGRALDWHLDARDRRDHRAGRALIRLLLAPDRAGTPRALARRMGVEEIIWDCSYWAAGMEQFRRYSPCFGKHGKRRRHVDSAVAHLDHIHFGFTRDGAWARTTFWRAVA